MTPEFRFRQFRVLAWNPRVSKETWLVLNRYVKFSITTYQQLQKAVDIVSERYHVLRTYYTASMFSDPRNLEGIKSRDVRLLKSYLVLESDKHIEYNMDMAKHVYGELLDRNMPCQIVYSGAKSIHLIAEFNYLKYLGIRNLKKINFERPLPFRQRIYYERVARYNFLHRILPEDLPRYGFDINTAVDPFRITPVPGTVNRKSRFLVTVLEPEDLLTTPSYIRNKSSDHSNPLQSANTLLTH